MNKRTILCVFIALAVTFSGFSQTTISITGGAPQVDDPTLQGELDSAINLMVNGLNDSFSEFLPENFTVEGLLKGFGEASVYASHGATMWAYGDYKSWSISFGSTIGLRLPDGATQKLFSSIRSGEEFNWETLKDYVGDNPTVGFIPQALNLNIGFRPSNFIKIIPKNLFLGVRLGYFGTPAGGLEIPFSMKEGENQNINIDYNAFVLGVTANYQLIPTVSLAGGLFRWRGLNIGSGFIYSSTKLDFTMPLGKIRSEEIGSTGSNLYLVVDPKANLKLEVTSFTVPVEISTGISVLIFNIPIGFGFDMGFGKTSISSGMRGDMYFDGTLPGGINQTGSGYLSINLNGSSPIDLFNFKLMTGLGITILDVVVIDVPITYYFNDGFNVGFTIGIRF